MNKIKVGFLFLLISFGSLNTLVADGAKEEKSDFSQSLGKLHYTNIIQDSNINYIILSDNSRWSIKDSDDETDFLSIVKQWQVGDDIQILDPETRVGEYYLKNNAT
ncbi:MAG: hypothetical protein KR126chlam6_00800 [Candidatus Anoxychlamydiales bacterium]|nr:hypothetical protein [Candidatus Anoxychlamydiales bacterium]